MIRRNFLKTCLAMLPGLANPAAVLETLVVQVDQPGGLLLPVMHGPDVLWDIIAYGREPSDKSVHLNIVLHNSRLPVLQFHMHLRACFRWIAAPGEDVLVGRGESILVQCDQPAADIFVALYGKHHVYLPGGLRQSLTAGGAA